MARIHVLVFHGYLLRGTGSNVYNASLAKALARLGHEVHLLCQDRGAASLAWVDRFGTWNGGRLQIEELGEAADGARGTVTAYVPDIAGLLPVYVLDRYEGFEVKAFPDLTDAELGRYLDANVGAVRDVVAAAGGMDAALANHLVMGPAMLARAGLGQDPGFAVKIHGSALEYVVKREPARFLPYAREGIEAASAVLVGSRHTAESLWAALDDPAPPAKTRLGPPGVDTELFLPKPRDEAVAAVRDLARGLGREAAAANASAAGGAAGGPRGARNAGVAAPLGGTDATGPAAQGAWGREPQTAAQALERWTATTGPRVVFVGKLIVAKGVDLLLAAWPLVVARHPGARLLIVAFGEYREGLERLWRALESGDLDAAREVAARGRGLEGGEEGPLPILAGFLGRASSAYPDAAVPVSYPDAALAASGSVSFAGRLEHDEVARLMPAADALVMPSTFAEAFGMVAAEAAAAGVLPVSAAHSGMLEVTRSLSGTLPPESAPLVSFELGPQSVEAIAERLHGWLGLDPAARARTREALAETARRLWSWEGVAQGVLAASAGRLDELPEVYE